MSKTSTILIGVFCESIAVCVSWCKFLSNISKIWKEFATKVIFTRLFTSENLVNIKLAIVQSQIKHAQLTIFMKVRIG